MRAKSYIILFLHHEECLFKFVQMGSYLEIIKSSRNRKLEENYLATCLLKYKLKCKLKCLKVINLILAFLRFTLTPDFIKAK